MKRNLIIAAILVVGSIVLYRVMHTAPSDTATPSEVPAITHVSVVPVASGNAASRDTSYQASVESIQNTAVKAFSSGTLTSLRVRLGDRVSVGQVLATVENPASSVDVSDASVRNADINQAQITVDLMKKAYQEARRVYDNDHTHANELAKKSAQLRYESAQVALQSLLDGHIVKSPVAGTVTSLPGSVNSTVSVGQDIATIGLPENAKVIFFVSQSQLSDIALGKKVMIQGNDQTVNGTITRIAPQADASTGKFFIEVHPETLKGKGLLPGTSAKVSVPTQVTANDASMVLPLEALLIGQNTNAIFVIHTGETVVHKVTADIVSIKGGVAEIRTRDMDAADSIVTSNVHSLDDGETVVIEGNK